MRDAVRTALRDALDDDAAFARFLGALVTEPRAPPANDEDDDGCWRDAVAEAAGGVRVDSFDAADAVCRGPGARLARVGSNLLCAGGVCREVPADVVSLLAGGDVIPVEDLAACPRGLLEELAEAGDLVFVAFES